MGMKLLLLEESLPEIDISQFDKVISFCRDDFINVETYYDLDEYFRLYNEVYGSFTEWMRGIAAKGEFVVEGVDILAAFGKTLFDFSFNLYQKIYLFKKILAKESPSAIFLIEPGAASEVTKYPFISLFASDFMPKGVSLNYVCGREHTKLLKGQKEVVGFDIFDLLLTLVRRAGNRLFSRRKKRILLYSDFLKIQKSLDFINCDEVIYLEKENPKRHFTSLLGKGVTISRFVDFSVFKNGPVREANVLIDRLDAGLSGLVINGIDLSAYLRKFLKRLWEKDLPRVFSEIRQLQALFALHPIETVLLDEDRTVSKNLVAQVASLCGRKSFVNCHGDPAHKIGYLPLTSDSIIVWGQQQKDLFREWGLSESRILVAGSSKYDGFINIPESDLRRKVFRDFNLKGDQPLLLLAPCPLQKRRNILDVFFWREIKNIISVVAALSDRANVVIKLHPGDDNDQSIKEFVRTIAPKIRVIETYDSLFLAKACDAMVVYLSTFSIDGLAFRKPVVLGAGHDYERFDCLKYFYDGTTSDKLRDSLVDILEGTATKHLRNWLSAADYVLSSMDGNSSKRIADMLSSGVGTDLAAQYQFAPQRYGENER